MAAEDGSLTQDSDQIAEEKSDHAISMSPRSPTDVTDSNAQLQKLKAREIIDACRRRDIEGLQALAESPGGFVTDNLRQQACELVCGDFSTQTSSLFPKTSQILSMNQTTGC